MGTLNTGAAAAFAQLGEGQRALGVGPTEALPIQDEEMKPGLGLARDAGDGVDVAVRAADAPIVALVAMQRGLAAAKRPPQVREGFSVGRRSDSRP